MGQFGLLPRRSDLLLGQRSTPPWHCPWSITQKHTFYQSWPKLMKGDKVMKPGDNFRLLSFPRNPRNDLACFDLWTTLALSGNQFAEKISSDKIDFLHPLCAAEKCRKWKKCCSKPNWLSPIPLLRILCNIGSYQISASTLKMECTKGIENHFGNASYIRETHTGGKSKEPTPKRRNC